jgi:cobalt/nickel transport protein
LRKIIIAIGLVIVFLAIFLPLASSNPDGLEKVAILFGAQEQGSIWNGLIPDYSLQSISNSYVSTLLSGIFGVTMVLILSLVLSKVMRPKASKSL